MAIQPRARLLSTKMVLADMQRQMLQRSLIKQKNIWSRDMYLYHLPAEERRHSQRTEAILENPPQAWLI